MRGHSHSLSAQCTAAHAAARVRAEKEARREAERKAHEEEMLAAGRRVWQENKAAAERNRQQLQDNLGHDGGAVLEVPIEAQPHGDHAAP